jgi:hypothetical protein
MPMLGLVRKYAEKVGVKRDVKPLIVKRCNLVRPGFRTRDLDLATYINKIDFFGREDLSFVLLSNINYKTVNFAVN